MTKTVYDSKLHPVELSDKDEIAHGGEAVLYRVPPGYRRAFKLYMQPNHPFFADDPSAQAAAKARLSVLQTKLRDFPGGLPEKIITPLELGTNKSGTRIEGYFMRYLAGAIPYWSYAQVEFRERGGIDPNSVVALHRKLHEIVIGGHAHQVVFADFNSLNVLVKEEDVFYCDADSIQFGKYLSPLYTLTYVDPLLCTWDDRKKVITLVRPHNENSDWYAYTVMLMEVMVYSGPYNGNYRPKDPTKRVTHGMRPLKRITVWNREVIYPKSALPLKVLPDDLASYFSDVFHHDKRGVFPLLLLDNLRWTTCTNCGEVHARGTCPFCAQAAPAAVKQKVIQRGKIMATRIFPTSTVSGTILHATTQGRDFNFLYHDGSELKREDGSAVSKSVLDTHVRYRIRGKATLFAKSGRLVVSEPGKTAEVIPVDSYGTLPMFDANGKYYYWLNNGSLYREGSVGPEFLGNVLENQTLFWVGSRFGFGFWRAGEITTGFIFDAERYGINDNVSLPTLKGQLLNSTATFSNEKVWFFTTSQIGGKTINNCTVIKSDGTIEATAEAISQDGSWLGVITGKCAIGNFLLSATDDGILRLEPNGGKIVVTKEFPDASQFVHDSSYLYPHADGLVAITGKEIYILKIS